MILKYDPQPIGEATEQAANRPQNVGPSLGFSLEHNVRACQLLVLFTTYITKLNLYALRAPKHNLIILLNALVF